MSEDLGWLALSSDQSKEVARGATYQEAVDKARILGESDPVLLKVAARFHLNKWVSPSYQDAVKINGDKLETVKTFS